MLELDPELLVRPAPRLGHQRDRVSRARALGVLDEVRVPRGDLHAPDPMALEPARLEHLAGTQLVVWVLEHASEGALVRRLGGDRKSTRLNSSH